MIQLANRAEIKQPCIRIIQLDRSQDNNENGLKMVIIQVKHEPIIDYSTKESQKQSEILQYSFLASKIFSYYAEVQKTHKLFDVQVKYAFIATQTEEMVKRNINTYVQRLNEQQKTQLNTEMNNDKQKGLLFYYRLYMTDLYKPIKDYKSSKQQ